MCIIPIVIAWGLCQSSISLPQRTSSRDPPSSFDLPCSFQYHEQASLPPHCLREMTFDSKRVYVAVAAACFGKSDYLGTLAHEGIYTGETIPKLL
mmetsp:Transcript_4035/g.5390  ORF Transcript_4035/g.5390 Transcript_4035/m.5390 type:complete len:95 (-) Transcript_4035:447-731(-)